MKSKLFVALQVKTGTFKLHSNSHLFTSETLIQFPGRRFEILESIPFNKKSLKRAINQKKANITIRNFPKSVDQLRNELKIADGGTDYLFFTTDLNNNKIVLICKKAEEIG